MFDLAPADTPPVPVQQHKNFVAALTACGQTPLCLHDSTHSLVILQRRFLGGVRMAMLARATLHPRRLAAQIAKVGLHRTPLILSPDTPTAGLAQLGAVPLITPTHVAEIDLRPSAETRRAALHQKWRNRLVHAESRGLRITRQNLPIDARHWVLAADALQQRKRLYRSWPTGLTLAYARENPGQAKLFTAFDGRDPVAAMLFLRHDTGATYHIGHTTRRGRDLSAHNLLLWQATNWLATRGHHRLDLGLINTEDAPGLARFKLGSGANLRTLGGTWLWWPVIGRALSPLAALDRTAF